MRIQSEFSSVERIGVQHETNFTIKATAKAFNILSSGLYSDKVLAVCREIMTNAVDSHTKANKKSTPFFVHIPTVLEPYFSVKDYGTGLTEEQIFTLYSTYFDSDKVDSDDFVGGLGLGSKSPFAYTPNFEVISIVNGSRKVYSIFLNEEGLPTVAKMMEGSSDEGNGMEVKFTVKKADFSEFRRKVEIQLCWFDTLPESNVELIQPTPFEPVLEGKNWSILPRRNSYRQTSNAIQGCVAYPIDFDALQITDAPFYSVLKEILRNHNLHIHLGIGEFDFAASREELQYNPKTIRVIYRQIELITNEFVKYFLGKISLKDSQSRWDNFIALHQIEEEWNIGITYIVNGTFRTKSKKWIILEEFVGYDKRLFQNSELGYLSHFTIAVYSFSNSRNMRPNRRLLNQPDKEGTKPTPGSRVFLNDIRSGGTTRATNEVLNKNRKTKVVIITPVPKSSLKPLKELGYTAERLEEIRQDEIKRLKDHTGITDFELISSLPDITQDDSPKRQFDRSVVSYALRNQSADWFRIDQSEIDFSAGGVYLLIADRTPVAHLMRSDDYFDDGRLNVLSMFHKPYSKSQVIKMMKTCKDYGLLTADQANNFFGFSVKNQKKIEQMDNWVNLYDLALDLFVKLESEYTFNRVFRYILERNNLVHSLFKQRQMVVAQIERLNKTGKYEEEMNKLNNWFPNLRREFGHLTPMKVVDRLIAMEVRQKQYETRVTSIANMLSEEFVHRWNKNVIYERGMARAKSLRLDTVPEMVKKYPLLQYFTMPVDGYSTSTSESDRQKLEHTLQYIRTVEEHEAYRLSEMVKECKQ